MTDLLALATDAGLMDATVTGSVFYLSLEPNAKVMAPMDHMIERAVTIGRGIPCADGDKAT